MPIWNREESNMESFSSNTLDFASKQNSFLCRLWDKHQVSWSEEWHLKLAQHLTLQVTLITALWPHWTPWPHWPHADQHLIFVKVLEHREVLQTSLKQCDQDRSIVIEVWAIRCNSQLSFSEIAPVPSRSRMRKMTWSQLTTGLHGFVPNQNAAFTHSPCDCCASRSPEVEASRHSNCFRPDSKSLRIGTWTKSD